MHNIAYFNYTAIQTHIGCLAVCDAQLRRLLGEGYNISSIHTYLDWRSLWTGRRDTTQESIRNSALFHILEECDGVFINGEGTIHDGNGLHLLAIAETALSLGKPTVIGNAVVSNIKGFDDVFCSLTDLNVREMKSSDFLSSLHIPHRIVLDSILDAKFDSRLDHSYHQLIACTDWNPSRHDVGRTVVEFLAANPKDARHFPFSHWSYFQDDGWRRAQSIIGGAHLAITALQHGLYLAALSGAPFVALPSSTSKVEGLLQMSPIKFPYCESLTELEKLVPYSLSNPQLFLEFKEYLVSNRPLGTFDVLFSELQAGPERSDSEVDTCMSSIKAKFEDAARQLDTDIAYQRKLQIIHLSDVNADLNKRIIDPPAVLKPDGIIPYVVYETGDVALAYELCAYLKANGFRPFIFCPYYLPPTQNYLETAKSVGVPYIYETGPLGQDMNITGQLIDHFGTLKFPTVTDTESIVGRMVGSRLYPPLSVSEAVIKEAKYLAAKIDDRFRLLSGLNATCLLMAEDNVERDSFAWIEAIHRLGKKAAVISHAIPIQGAALRSYANSQAHIVDTDERKSIAALIPRWTVQTSNSKIFRLPPARALAFELLNVAPENPFTVNSGNTDACFVESEYVKAVYARLGYESSRLIVLGHPIFDLLYERVSQRNVIRANLLGGAKQAEMKIILLGLAPDQYPDVRAPEFNSYFSLVCAILNPLTQVENCQVVLSPHPTIKSEIIDLLSKEYPKIEIVTKPIADILCAADLFISTVSTVIKWARALKIPVINYDCYSYKYDHFDGFHGIANARNYNDYLSLIKLLSKPNWNIALNGEGEDPAFWGILDGKRREVILEAIRDLASDVSLTK